MIDDQEKNALYKDTYDGILRELREFLKNYSYLKRKPDDTDEFKTDDTSQLESDWSKRDPQFNISEIKAEISDIESVPQLEAVGGKKGLQTITWGDKTAHSRFP